MTVVIPARDEEDVLGDCLHAVRAQTHEDLCIVVVNDGSTDATADIAERHAADDERVHVVHVDGLPSGWSGKVHALYLGVEKAREQGVEDWMVFLDADMRPHPELVARLVTTAHDMDADLVSTAGGPPTQPSLTWWLLIPPGAQLIAENASPDGRGRKALALGHCILMRHSSYEKVGGWQALPDARPEDVVMATRVRDHGGKTRFTSGTDMVTTNGVDPLGAGWQSFRKSMVTGTGSNFPLLAAGGVAHVAFGLTPPLAVAAGLRWHRKELVTAGAVGWAAQAAGHALGAKRMGGPMASAALGPFTWALFGGVLLDAARHARRGSTSWKGRSIAG